MVIAQGEVWWADLGEPIGSAVDRAMLVERVGRLPEARLAAILSGIDVVLGR